MNEIKIGIKIKIIYTSKGSKNYPPLKKMEIRMKAAIRIKSRLKNESK